MIPTSPSLRSIHHQAGRGKDPACGKAGDRFEDSVRNRIRNHEMAAYKDSLAHRLFREAQEIRKQLDNPNSK